MASRQEEARAAQQQESSLNAATAEAIFSDALWKSPTSLGLLPSRRKPHPCARRPSDCEATLEKKRLSIIPDRTMRVAAERARAAESATLRSALTEAAKGANAFHRAEDAERELRRLRLDRSEKDKQVQDLTQQLFNAERRASAALDASSSQLALPEKSLQQLQQIQRQLGILSGAAAMQGPMQDPPPPPPPDGRPTQGQGPIDAPMQGVRAGPMPGTEEGLNSRRVSYWAKCNSGNHVDAKEKMLERYHRDETKQFSAPKDKLKRRDEALEEEKKHYENTLLELERWKQQEKEREDERHQRVLKEKEAKSFVHFDASQLLSVVTYCNSLHWRSMAWHFLQFIGLSNALEFES
eukprot:symbB.v1.2.038507.t1/scaffold6019.1/size21733/3